jgi:hypothetical protein
MAIRRCPYCKAIIDEQDKYCNNCGTQLLFPEDEFVEEEIKGDRIVDDDEPKEEELEEESEEEIEEKEGSKEEEEEEEPEDEDTETDEEEELDEKESKRDDDSGELDKTDEEEDEEEEGGEEEDIEEDEEEKDQLRIEAEGALRGGEADQDEEEAEEETEENEEEEEIEEPAKEIEAGETASTTTPAGEPHKKYRVSIEEDELVFRTRDLENLTRTVEEGKEKLEEFLGARQKAGPKPVTPHEAPALFQEGEEPGTATKELVPPWASGMKASPPSTADLEEVEKGAKEKGGTTQAPTGPGWTTDSGIGIPEKVTQAGLPFGTAALPAAEAEKREEMEAEEKEMQAEPAQRAGFSLKIKSKLVDLAFITALWLVTLWFTAQVIGVTFLQVISGSPVAVLALYFILLFLYFFLFLYFLGETLGDHYFSDED